MAQLVGKVTQDLANQNKVAIKGEWSTLGDASNITSPFEYTSLDSMEPVRCAHKSESVTRELPGSGEYVGKFTLSSTSGKTEHKENKVLLKCTKHPKEPEKLVLVNGTGSNEFGQFEIHGTIEISSQIFKVVKNYVTPSASGASQATTRVGGSGRIRKKKRPYSPPNVPKPPKIRKVSASAPSVSSVTKPKKGDTNGAAQSATKGEKKIAVPDKAAGGVEEKEEPKSKSEKKNGKKNKKQKEDESSEEEESEEEESEEEESSEEETSSEEEEESSSEEEESSEEESSSEEEEEEEAEEEEKENEDEGASTAAAPEPPSKTPEEIAAEIEAARKKKEEEEREARKFKGKRHKVCTVAEFEEAKKEETMLQIGVHYLYAGGMEKLVSVPTEVIADEGIERKLLMGGGNTN
eukprot:g14860.t1